jgi:hypothetical protein
MLTRLQKLEFPSPLEIRNPKTGQSTLKKSVAFLKLVQNKWCDHHGNLLKLPQPSSKRKRRDPVTLGTFDISSKRHEELFIAGIVDCFGNFIQPGKRLIEKIKTQVNALERQQLYVTIFPDLETLSMYDANQDVGIRNCPTESAPFKLMVHNINNPQRMKWVQACVQTMLQQEHPEKFFNLIIKVWWYVHGKVIRLQTQIAERIPQVLVYLVELYLY